MSRFKPFYSIKTLVFGDLWETQNIQLNKKRTEDQNLLSFFIVLTTNGQSLTTND